MDLKKLNEELIYNYHISIPINEMAKINGYIEVHNDDDNSLEADQLKFAHFHYHGVHFKFSRNIPKNAREARKMIAFSKEQKKISDKELNELCDLLRAKPTRKNISAPTVYKAAIDTWEVLNDRDADYID